MSIPNRATTSSDGSPTRRAVAVPYSTIRREPVSWLVPGIPLKALSILGGVPGLGKTLYTQWLAAELSKRGVASLLLSAEDSEGATIRPRLDACEAMVELVHAVRLVHDAETAEGLSLPRDIDALGSLIAENNYRLVVVDPVVAYLDSGIDSHKDASVRQALAPLARIADVHGCAVLCVLHVNKADGSDWFHRLSGSVGFGGAARSVLLFGKDPDDEDEERSPGRLLAHAKCNVAGLASSQRWRIAPIVLPAANGDPETRTARLELVGESEHSAQTILGSGADLEERLPRDQAEDFLRVELFEGAQPSKDVQRAAREAGIADRTLTRARARIGVILRKQGFGKGAFWTWELPRSTKMATPSATGLDAETWPSSENPSIHGESSGSETPKSPKDGHVSEMAIFVAESVNDENETAVLAAVDELVLEGALREVA